MKLMNRSRVFYLMILLGLIFQPLAAQERINPLEYHFVVSDQDGEIVPYQLLTIQVSVFEGTPENGDRLYSETHQETTNEKGELMVEIGDGSTKGDFSQIVWNVDKAYYVKAIIEELGDRDYVFEHSSRLLFYTPRIFSGDISHVADPRLQSGEPKEMRALGIEDNRMYLSNGNYVELPQYLTNSNSLLIKVDKRDVSCYGESDGAIDIDVQGGNPPYDYYWSNEKTTQDLDNLKAGEYNLYVTDSKGFTAIKRVGIKQPDSLRIETQIRDVSGIGREDGSIRLDVSGGRPPYSYRWSNGSRSRDQKNLAPGVYQLSVTSRSGCSVNKAMVVKEPVRVSFTKQNVGCYGESTGSVRLDLQGGKRPYDIRWSNNQTGYKQTELPAGKYYVFIRDNWGYTVVDSVNILQPYPLKVQASVTNIDQSHASGRIDLQVQGGIPPYDYQWSTMDTTQSLADIQDGVFSVKVTDDNGCETIRNNLFVYRMMTDRRDTAKYRVITIGSQVWMADNMNYGKQIMSDKISTRNGEVEKYCYNNDPENCEMLGGLYTWDEMMDYSRSDDDLPGETRGICPDGWHIPTSKEWKMLADYLGGEMVAANRMKNYDYWPTPEGMKEVRLDLSGFSAYPAGRMDMAGESYYIGRSSSYWSATKDSWKSAWHRTITNRGGGLYRNSGHTGYRFSVRCLKDPSE